VARHKVSGNLILSLGSDDGKIAIYSLDPSDIGKEIFNYEIIKNKDLNKAAR
jgi:hypothetical protein